MGKKTEIKNGWSIDTIYEIISDLVCFEFILKIKTLIKDVEAKAYLSQFLKIIVPVYVYEIANSLESFGIVKKEDFFNSGMNKKVQAERMRAIKQVIVKSSQCEKIAQEMGLNFNNKIYDMNIVLRNNDLVGMNYEDYIDRIDDGDTEFWESLFDFPRRSLDAFLASLNLDMNLDNIINENIETLKKVAMEVERELHFNRYSYSAYTLFLKSNSLDMRDKIFMLYRYRLISSVEYIEKALPPFNINLGDKCIVSLCGFFRKYKALIIAIIGDELKELNTEFGSAVKNGLDSKIKSKEFWALNRAVRNNLHYVETHVLKQEEIELIDQYQPVYLSTIKNLVLENLNIDVGKECIRVTNFFNACLNKGLDKKDVLKYQSYYYLKFLISGKV
jgi:hypothetical protein